MPNPVAVAHEHSQIADKVFNDYVKFVLETPGETWDYKHLNKLSRRANDADRKLLDAKHVARNECTCLPDLPDGRVNGGRGTVCPVCTADSAEEWTP